MLDNINKKNINDCNDVLLAKLPAHSFIFQDSDFTNSFKINNSSLKEKPDNIKLFGSNADKVLQLLLYDGSLTIAQISAKIGLAEITIKRIIKELQNNNIIMREGGNKIGTWIVNVDIK